MNLKNGKAMGKDGLKSEHLKFAHPLLFEFLTKMFNIMIQYNFIPDELMAVVLAPMLKKKGLDPKNMNNYRPIALAPLSSKIFKKSILLQNLHFLASHINQFCFKRTASKEFMYSAS